MSENALPKGYEPHAVEDHWREYWEKNKTFTPDPDAPGEPFSIVIPPPNVTGALHIGHALNHTLIDVLCRHARQKGKKVLWLPGTDHAGIATQNVVERALAKEGKTRHDLGREAFVERVWQWKEDYGNRILNQIRMLGDSVDWTRERFTMDEGLSKAVRKVFVELYKEGYIYKGKYIINWCSRCHTALADDEVDHMPEKGHLYHVRYDFEDGSGSVIIATTRPETIMADTGVCVHPEDERYAGLVGKKIVVPVIGRVVPLFADRYVDKEFGTGALKVTPCHDPNDWTLGERHGLEFIQCIDEDGNMTAEAGPYAGLSKEECRKRIVEDLQASGQLVKIEDLDHSVGHCYRCKTVVEPHMSEQWFVASTKLAPRARAAVPEMTQIFPENWMKTYYNWLDNIRDWCISRQIWWGHRIPAWTCPQCGKLIVSEEDPTSCPDCGSTELVQESDVLDTWFSSALWPFSTMGWPDKTKDLATFYPTSVLVTGFDILFFWVAPHDDDGPALHGSGALQARLPARPRARRAGPQNVQVHRQRHRPVGDDRKIRHRRPALHPDGLRRHGPRHPPLGRPHRRLPPLRQQAVERFPVRAHEPARGRARRRGTRQGAGAPSPVAAPPPRRGQEGCGRRHRSLPLQRRRPDPLQVPLERVLRLYLSRRLDMKEEGPRKTEAQYVLWTALREFLILMHPIMPFVTAEIWQALPGGAGSDAAVQPCPKRVPAASSPKPPPAWSSCRKSSA